jgi:hypothetical protein
MEKKLVVILSDPKSATEEAVGRVFNALAFAYDMKERKQDVKIVFQGTGTRWISELENPKHMLNALYRAVEDRIDGACGGCADVFGATRNIEEAELPLLRELKIPGTTGLTSLVKYLKDGYSVVNF